MLTAWRTRERSAIWHDLLAPTPGRLGRTLEITIKVAIVVVISMTFQIPSPAVSAYLVFFVSKEDSGRSILISVVFIAAFVLTIGFVFLLASTTLNYPSLRILFIAAASFVMFFLGKASKLAPLASVLGLVTAGCLNAEQDAPIGEIATRGFLFVGLFATFPMAVNLVFNVFFGHHPERMLREGLAKRLAAASDALVARDANGSARLSALIAGGNAEFAAELKMTALFRRLPRDTIARLKALVTLSYALALTIAARGVAAPSTDDDAAMAARLDRLARTIRDLPDTIDPATPAEPASMPEGNGPSPQVEALTATMEAVVSGGPLPDLGLEAPAKPEPKSGFFKPDAFSNPDYERFAAKATAAVVFCYLTFNLLDWPGISTCMITCFVVALSTVGESTQKMTLRLTGCTFGAALGYAAIVFVLPHMTQITGLVVLVAIVTLPAGWIAFGSPRVAYLGFQIAFAAYLCVLQGTEPKFDLTTARDRFIGILLGNVTIYVIFTQVYVASLLPSLSRDLVAIIARCRDVLQAIAAAKPLAAISEQVAGVQALVQQMDAEIVAYGFEKRSTRYGRLHVLSCRLIERALRDVVADIGRVAATPTPDDASGARAALDARCSAIDRRLEALGEAISRHKPIVVERSNSDRGAVAATEDRRSGEFDRLDAHLDRLAAAAARYRRILRKDAEGAYA